MPSRNTFRTAIEDFGFTGAFDPTAEDSQLGMALQSQLLVRTLVTYRHVAGAAGVEVVPDLATDTGRVSPDGLTWTFTLKEGIRFGPPLTRPITASDIEYAFRRMQSRQMVAPYAHLYRGLIVGMEKRGKTIPADISGIETPDARTLRFHLTRPAGDLAHRLTLPATGPIPPEVADCFKQPGDYGRDLVSSGPYMVWGAHRVKTSSCKTIQPMPGFDPTRWLLLVRNPNYDRSTDTPDVRGNDLDGVDIRIDTNTDAIAEQVDSGALDAAIGPGSFGQPELFMNLPHAHEVRWQSVNTLEYISMNLLVPPFDDLHVRRAVLLALDREAILDVFGGPERGPLATHIFPPFVGTAISPAPNASTAGDLAAARHEMSLSEYDEDGDGICDVEVCREILFIAPTSSPEVDTIPLILPDLEALGLNLVIREIGGGRPFTYPVQGVVKNLVPISLNRALLAEYPDPSPIARSLHSSGIACVDQVNYSEVGITEAQAKKCEVLKQWKSLRDHLPSLDGRIEACERLAGDERSACWAEFDRHVMAEVVPWVPLRWPNALFVTSDRVERFEFDQAFGMLSFCHLRLRDAGL